MVLLSEIQRQYLKMASSGLSSANFMNLEEDQQDQFIRKLDKVVYGLMEESPEAFTERALIEHKKKNRLTYELGS